MRGAILAALLLLPPAAQARPVLVEMFVSQSCSSCPPADALLQRLAAADKDILPLSLNVTYWNYLSWHDTDSLDAATARQYWYGSLGGGDVYTPEAVVDGTAQLVGSDAAALQAAIAAARGKPAGDVPVRISGGSRLEITIGPGTGQARVELFGYDERHVTAVKAGENAGVVITEMNVVRDLTDLGAWSGGAETFTLPRPAGQHVAALVQSAQGAVLGLARL